MSASSSASSVVYHELSAADAPVVAAAREYLAPMKGQLKSPDARAAFDAIMDQVPEAQGVTYERATVGGIDGVWARPENAGSETAILHLHGGAYILGSAWAYRRFAGQIAARARANAFVADYRLAPEHRFPAALDDALAAYRGLLAMGKERVALVGDSAGGGLALALMGALAAEKSPSGAVVLSPWGDLTLTGESMTERADADPMVTRDMLATTGALYLAGADPTDPRASPALGPYAATTPVQLHVGEDEVLLDDARRYAAGVAAAGGRAELHVWAGMAHVFPSNVESLEAAASALALMGEFLREALLSRD